ncbi:MAG TPA: hypothetical protein VII12_03045 [Thermoanaerobaculia bacterium]
MISLLLATLLLMQQDQIPRRPKKDDRGLLKIDPVYFDLAASTGGDFYFWAPGEFATSQLQVPVHREDVLLSYGTVESKKTFDIPVESGVKEMTLFAGIQRKDLAVLIRPDGTVMRDVQSFQHMLIAMVKAPATGIWRLELHGAGTYAVTAHVKPADDGPELVRFAFVEPGGRPGHEGMFPVKRPVHSGESLTCEVSLSGSVKDPELVFVTRDGSLIGTAPMNGQCKVPDVPFRVMIRGADANGFRFQRIVSGLITPD